MKRILAASLVVVLLLAAAVVLLNLRDEEPIDASSQPSAPASAEQIARGAYLAQAGSCMGCHTARGGAAYAGGRGLPTPFGTVYASNLTPDVQTGIGSWSRAHFWRALHNGRSRDGRLLYPAFPYTNYTSVTREDADALYAYLMSLAPVVQENRKQELRFPFNQQAALAVWRALYFRPGQYKPDAARSAEWNRGAYLVGGLGHCNACHASRNVLGAVRDPLDFNGGLIPVQNWYAPSLQSPEEASVADWDREQVITLLRAGVSQHASVMGPMAEVVRRSTQYLSEPDLRAMANFLQSLPLAHREKPPAVAQTPASAARGERLYGQHCARCHGEQGEGAPGAYPALAGNRAVTLDPPANLVHVVLAGGFPPATTGNPRPFGMPPFANDLNDEDIAAVLSYIRHSWGNQGVAVSVLEVNRYRRAAWP
jgi:mono/diheme cytochrome c family protein